MDWIIYLGCAFVVIALIGMSLYGFFALLTYKTYKCYKNTHTEMYGAKISEEIEVLFMKVLRVLDENQKFLIAYDNILILERKIRQNIDDYMEKRIYIGDIWKAKNYGIFRKKIEELDELRKTLDENVEAVKEEANSILDIDNLLQTQHNLFDNRKKEVMNYFKQIKIDVKHNDDDNDTTILTDPNQINFYNKTKTLKELMINHNNNYLRYSQDTNFELARSYLLKYKKTLVEFTKIINGFKKLNKFLFITALSRIKTLENAIEKNKIIFFHEHSDYWKKLNIIKKHYNNIIQKMEVENEIFNVEGIFDYSNKLNEEICLLHSEINRDINTLRGFDVYEIVVQKYIQIVQVKCDKIFSIYHKKHQNFSKSERDSITRLIKQSKILFKEIKEIHFIVLNKNNEYSISVRRSCHYDIVSKLISIERYNNEIGLLIFKYEISFKEKISRFRDLLPTFDYLISKVINEKLVLSKKEKDSLNEFVKFQWSLNARIESENNLKDYIIEEVVSFEKKLKKFNDMFNEKIILKEITKSLLIKLNAQRNSNMELNFRANKWEQEMFKENFTTPLSEMIEHLKKGVQ